MNGSDEGQRSGKAAKDAIRAARLAIKLRQNLARRKEKVRAAAKAADHAAVPVMAEASVPLDDNDQGD